MFNSVSCALASAYAILECYVQDLARRLLFCGGVIKSRSRCDEMGFAKDYEVTLKSK